MLRSGSLPDGRYAPGVHYVEAFEADASARLRTGVPVFIGASERARDETAPFYVSRWEDFALRVPGSLAEGYLGAALRGFFDNGGTRCAVVTVPRGASLGDALVSPFAAGSVLDDMEDVDLVCVPDAMLVHDEATVYRIQQAALEHCRRTSRVAILDSLPLTRSPESSSGREGSFARVREQRDTLPRAREGALYFPWVHVTEAATGDLRAPTRTRRRSGARRNDASPAQHARRLVPPCGHVAGIYARVDATQGAHKPPANEIVEGVVDVEWMLDEHQHAALNELGVNCIHGFTGRGIRVWGARTLSGLPSWRHVNVTRVFLTLTRWMTYRLDDLVFEPHTPLLWERVRERLSSYCLELFERGALKGATAQEAFFVKCDAETNPVELRERGALVAQIGLAAAAPAEFIVVYVTQRARGAAVTP